MERRLTRSNTRRSTTPYGKPSERSTGKAGGSGLTSYMAETSLEFSAVSVAHKARTLTARLEHDSVHGFGLTINAGNVITSVIPGSPAHRAGLTACDVVSNVDGADARGRRVLEMVPAGARVIVLTLERPAEPQRRAMEQELGISKLKPLKRSGAAEEANVQTDFTVVLSREVNGVWGLRTDDANALTEVTVDTAAQKAGLQVGDVVTKIGSKLVAGSVRELILSKAYTDKTNLVLTVSRAVKAVSTHVSNRRIAVSADL